MARKELTAEQKAARREYKNNWRRGMKSQGLFVVKEPTPEQRERNRQTQLDRYYRKREEILAKQKASGRDRSLTDDQKKRVAVYQREWYLANKEIQNAKNRERYLSNKESWAAKSREYRHANKDELKAKRREWRQNHMPEVLTACRNRRARNLAAAGRHTHADVANLFAAQRGVCAGCDVALVKSGKGKMHVDHIMPLALGGSNWPDNLQLLCPFCNISKHAKHPDQWARERGRLFA